MAHLHCENWLLQNIFISTHEKKLHHILTSSKMRMTRRKLERPTVVSTFIYSVDVASTGVFLLCVKVLNLITNSEITIIKDKCKVEYI